MSQYEVVITENGLKRTNWISTRWEKPKQIAHNIINTMHVREDGFVRFAKVCYDPTTDTFKPSEYSFIVKDGCPEDFKTVQ